MNKTASQTDALLAWMGALADGTRLRLLKLLENHELGVVDLCEVLQMPQSTVSRHLRILGQQDWLTSRRQGTTHLYSMLLDELEPAARKLWVVAREQLAESATLQQDELRLKQVLAARNRDKEQFFDDAAQQWDRLRDELYGSAFTKSALASLVPAEWTIADLGCGAGTLTEDLARSAGKVIGLDDSPAMLKAAKKRCRTLSNVELLQGSVVDCPIADATCDAALMLIVLSYVETPSDAMAQASRILKPGGKLVVVDLLVHDREDFRREMGQEHTGFSPSEVKRWLKQAGLKDVQCHPLPTVLEATGPALILATGVKPT